MANKKDLLSGGAARLFSQQVSQTADSAADEPRKEKRATKAERIREEISGTMKPSVAKVGRPAAGENRVWTGHQNFTTSMVFDKDQYLKVREIAYQERLAIKETVFLLLQKGISAYEKNGKL